jgi:hypothetical protein
MIAKTSAYFSFQNLDLTEYGPDKIGSPANVIPNITGSNYEDSEHIRHN